jgi:hypothetical protein
MAPTAPLLSSVPADPDQWSEASQRSYAIRPTHYYDLEYNCVRCGQPSVFTAQAQRTAFEVRKVHIRERRTLCEPCFLKRGELEHHLQQCAIRWQAEKEALAADPRFLQEWLALLEDHARYGARYDAGNARMLRKLLGLPPHNENSSGA